MNPFQEFPKIPRFNREVIITEKIDGTNGQILIVDAKTAEIDYPEPLYSVPWLASFDYPDGQTLRIAAGSRNRFLTLGADNFGFAKWVAENAPELVRGLGVGRHFGEWWGKGIQRGYGQKGKRFSLFNVCRWKGQNDFPNLGVASAAGVIPWREAFPELFSKQSDAPACCDVVPILSIARGIDLTFSVASALLGLREEGSYAATGFNKPEGIVIFHTAGLHSYKVTLENDDKPKSTI